MKKYFEKLKQNSMLGRRMRDGLKMKAFCLFVLTLMFAAPMSENPAATLLAVAPIASFVAFAKKESELTVEEKQTLGTIESMVNKCMEDYASNTISEKEYKEQMKVIDEKLKSASDNNKEIKDLRDVIKSMGEEIEKMKGRGIVLGSDNPISKVLDEFMNSEKFGSYVKGDTKSSGNFRLELKDAVSITNNYTGSLLLTQQQSRVEVQVSEKKINFRNLMMVDQGDPAFTSTAWSMIYELDRGATFTSENGRLSKSSFKIKEQSSELKRVGTYVPLSKRLLKSRVYIKSWIMNRLPSWVKMAEDFQIMFGDGTGNNLLGITKYEGVKCVSKIITEAVISGEAGTIDSVKSYDGGKATIVVFKNPLDKIIDGQKVTIEGATVFTELNASFVLTKISDREIMIELPYKAGAVLTAATFTVKNNFFNTISAPNLGDAVKAIFAVMSYAEYTPNMIALNPSTLFEIETLKDTTGRDMGLVTLVGGVKYVAGRPVVETTCIKPDYYFCGDMMNGASLIDYSAINVRFVDDLEGELTNQTTVIIDEEIIMPVYNPWSFAYGKLSDVLTAIKKS